MLATLLSIILLLVLITTCALSQNSAVGIDYQHKDIGSQENIYKIKADYIITNNQAKNLYLLRADALKDVMIFTSKKTIRPNDTALISVEFIPKTTGKFNQQIKLITSADASPFIISLQGVVKSIKSDDKTACFHFGKPNKAGAKTIEPIILKEDTKLRDVSNRIPDNTTTNNTTQVTISSVSNCVTIKNEIDDKEETITTLLSKKLYKPNNIVFVVDVSSSMKDSVKLPVMKEALHHLIEALRPTDKVTFITYSDSVKLLKDGVSGKQKEELNNIVKKLKARGLTKGKKAILFGLDVALKNYIEGGNNQILLITDGKFRFYPDDQKLFINTQHGKSILLSTVALGNDKDALKNLKEIAEIGKGNFIHVKKTDKAKVQLLNEIKQQSAYSHKDN